MPGVPARPLVFAGSRTGGRGTFSCARESTQRAGIPPPAGGGTRRWGDFSHARKVTKSAPKVEHPLGYPPLSCTAFLSFRRTEPAVAPVPPAPSGLVHSYASAIPPPGPPGPGEMGPPQKPSAAVFVGRGAAAEWMSFRQRRKRRIWSLRRRGRLAGRGASAYAPLEVQARRLEHHGQAPIGVGQSGKSSRQKAGGRHTSLGVSAGVRRSIETGTSFAPP